MKLTTQQLEDALKESRNNAAEAAQSAKDALTQVNSLCDMLDALIKDNARLSTENTSLSLRIDALQRQIITNSVSAGATPRANGGNNQNRSTIPHIIVDTHSIRINNGIQKLLAKKNWRFAQFFETDVAHVIEVKFRETPDIQCVSLDKNPTGGLYANSVDAVNAVFGGVKIGSPSKIYSAALKKGTDDTIYIWPNTIAFALGKITPTTSKLVVVNTSKSQKVSCVTGRMRVNAGVFKQIVFTGAELFVTITPAASPDEYEMKFSSTQTPGSYVLVPRKSAAVPYEICNTAALRAVGYNPAVFKTYIFDTEYVSSDTVLLTRLNYIKR